VLGQALLQASSRLRPIIKLDAYGVRLGASWSKGTAALQENVDTVERAWEEFALLTYLELEARKKLPKEPKWLRRTLKEALEQDAVVDATIAANLRAAL